MNKLKRRDFLKLTGLALAGSFVIGTTHLYLNDESQEPVVERVSIPLSNLKPALAGFRIVQISDIHLQPFTKPELVRKAVDLANGLAPDLIVLTGDYVWRDVDAVYELTPILADLNAKYGVFAIMGNHEIWTDAGVVQNAFDEIRLPILINQGVELSAGGNSLYLVGLDDGWSGHPDLAAALENAPGDTPVILLYHEPDLADDVSKDSRVSLQLAGHSHGGQIRFPGIGALLTPYLSWKYDHGLYRVNQMWLYTNRGIGVTNIPVRYNCPPEVTEITLTTVG
jgi:predicted MPP superfamily phosphohydrolase